MDHLSDLNFRRLFVFMKLLRREIVWQTDLLSNKWAESISTSCTLLLSCWPHTVQWCPPHSVRRGLHGITLHPSRQRVHQQLLNFWDRESWLATSSERVMKSFQLYSLLADQCTIAPVNSLNVIDTASK